MFSYACTSGKKNPNTFTNIALHFTSIFYSFYSLLSAFHITETQFLAEQIIDANNFTVGEEKCTFRETDRVISGSKRFFNLAEVCKLKSAEFKLEMKYMSAFGAEQ